MARSVTGFMFAAFAASLRESKFSSFSATAILTTPFGFSSRLPGGRREVVSSAPPLSWWGVFVGRRGMWD